MRTWVLAAVRNRAIDALRRGALSDRHGTDAEQAVQSIAAADRTEAEVVRREGVRELRGALGGLPSEQRQVIELAYFGGFTHSEIAGMLELPIGTVKGRMRLGLTKMRMALGDPTEVTM